MFQNFDNIALKTILILMAMIATYVGKFDVASSLAYPD